MEEYNFTEHYKIGDVIHYLRVLENLGINDVIECRLRTVKQDYMVACDDSKQGIYISLSAKDLLYTDRKLALKESKKHHVRKVTKESYNED